MNKTFATAIVAGLASAQQDDVVAMKFDAMRHLTTAPNLTVTTEADCTALDPTGDLSIYYTYEWNTDDCYCSHVWKSSHPWYSYYSSCPSPQVLNPFHEPGNAADRCITEAERDTALSGFSCPPLPPPEPTCDDLYPNSEFASAAVIMETDYYSFPYGSGFARGFLNFQEMCEGTCGFGMYANPDPCTGVCISGKIWGLTDGVS